MLDGEHLHPSEAGLFGVGAQGLRAEDGAGGRGDRGGRNGPAVGEAAEDAKAVHQALQVVRGGGERLADALVHHQHRPSGDDQPAHGAQGADGVWQVVQGLADEGQVVLALQGGVGGVADVEGGAPGHPLGGGVGAGHLDRRGVQIVAVHARVRVGEGDGDARPAGAAGEVGDAGRGRIRRGGPGEAGVEVWDGGEPLPAQEAEEDGAVLLRLALAQIGAHGVPGDALPAAEGSPHGRGGPAQGDGEPPQVGQVVQAVHLRQHLGVPGGEGEASLPWPRGGVLDVQDPAGGLLLQPLPGVALIRPGAGGQPGRAGGAPGGQGPVEPQAVAEVDGEEVHRPQGGLEEAPGEGVAPGGLGRIERWRGRLPALAVRGRRGRCRRCRRGRQTVPDACRSPACTVAGVGAAELVDIVVPPAPSVAACRGRRIWGPPCPAPGAAEYGGAPAPTGRRRRR